MKLHTVTNLKALNNEDITGGRGSTYLYHKAHSMSVCHGVHFFEKLPSLNASSPLECIFKPEGRALATGGGHEASYLRVN